MSGKPATQRSSKCILLHNAATWTHSHRNRSFTSFIQVQECVFSLFLLFEKLHLNDFIFKVEMLLKIEQHTIMSLTTSMSPKV